MQIDAKNVLLTSSWAFCMATSFKSFHFLMSMCCKIERYCILWVSISKVWCVMQLQWLFLTLPLWSLVHYLHRCCKMHLCKTCSYVQARLYYPRTPLEWPQIYPLQILFFSLRHMRFLVIEMWATVADVARQSPYNVCSHTCMLVRRYWLMTMATMMALPMRQSGTERAREGIEVAW